MSGPFAAAATHHGTAEAGNGAPKSKRELMLAGIAAILITVLLVLHKRAASSSAAAAPATDPNADALSAAGYPTGGTGTFQSATGSDTGYSDLQQSQATTNAELAALAAAIGQMGAVSAASPAPPPRGGAHPPAAVAPPPRANPPVTRTSNPVAAKPTSYTVRPGDNLSSIGAKYGKSWQSIYAANRGAIGANPNLIHPGLVLTGL